MFEHGFTVSHTIMGARRGAGVGVRTPPPPPGKPSFFFTAGGLFVNFFLPFLNVVAFCVFMGNLFLGSSVAPPPLTKMSAGAKS